MTWEVCTRLDPAGRAAVDAFLERLEAAEGHPPISEAKRLLLERDEPSGYVLLVERSGPDGEVTALVEMAPAPQGWVVEVAADGPVTHRRAALGEGAARAVAEATARGASELELWVPRAGPDDDSAVGACGFHPWRDLLHLRCRLPLEEAPPRLALSPFRPGVDEEAWLALNARAFHRHPEQGRWTREDLVQREGEAWFDPAGFLLLWEAGRLAGACWTKLHPPGSGGARRGEIYVVCVDPDEQGRGLGRALTVAGLGHLAAVGADTGVLYVDAANEPAVTLYRSLGFTVDHVDRAYRRTAPS